jgi:hypothetical protein
MYCSINGQRCYRLNLSIPARGLWSADAVLDDVISFTGTSITLVLAGLTLVGSVVRGGNYSGEGSLRIVGGKGGWMQTIPQRFYQNPNGIKLGPVLADAAKACGESVTIDADTTLGLFFTREAAPACRVLNQLCPSWYVQPDGTTRVGDRATPTIASAFDMVDEFVSPYLGRIPIATDFPEDWVPGAKFTAAVLGGDVFQVSDVVHRLTPERLRTECWLAN